MAEPFTYLRDAARALLALHSLSETEPHLCGFLRYRLAPLSDEQANWLRMLLSRHALSRSPRGVSFSGYPDIPGAREPGGTSQDAAEAIGPAVSHLRRLAVRSLARLGEATPLEAIAVSGVARESLQPRFSELRTMGLIEPTGARRRNPSGRSASVLRLTNKGRAVL